MANVSINQECGIFEPPAKPKITKEMKAAMKESGLSKAEQKAALAEQLAAAKEKYASDTALWKAKPQTPQEEVDALKAVLDQKIAEMPSRKAEIKELYKKETEEAKALSDDLAKKLALSAAKNKRHNALLDLSEELRVARDNYQKATLSSDELYKYQEKVKRRASIWRDRHLYFMLIPFVIFFVSMYYLPMYGLLMAFKDYSPFKGVFESPWAPMNGFYHFYSFFTGPYLTRLVGNTLAINILCLIFSFPAPILFALLLNETRYKMYKTSVQTITYLPHFVSTVVIAGIVVNFLSPSSGIINVFYKWISGSDTGIYFLVKPEYFRTIYVTMNVWQSFGFGSIIYTSALAGIDMELYEAARIDGAGRFRQLISITIPSIMPTIAIMLIMRVGNLLSLGYETIILLYQPSTYVTADVISTYVYRVGLIEGNYSLSTAVGLVNGLIALILVYTANTISRKVGEVGLW